MRKIHRKQIKVTAKHAVVDGVGHDVDTSSLPSDWHAVTFIECVDSGECLAEIEFIQDPFAGPKGHKGNKVISREEFENHAGCCDVFKQWVGTPSYEERHCECDADAELELAEAIIKESEDEADHWGEEKRTLLATPGVQVDEVNSVEKIIGDANARAGKARGAKVLAQEKKARSVLARKQRVDAFLRDGMKAVPKKVV